jgi:2-haloalkanoic acid dehalogenase type II
VKAVFFDFAGTLFSDRALRDAHLRQLQFVARAAAVEATDEELRAAYRQGMGVAYRAVAVRTSYSHRTLFAAAFAATATALGGAIDEATAAEAVDRQYRATIDEAVLRPDCLETLAALRRASIHVQVVSNIDDEQIEPLLDRLGVIDVIDAWTSSEQAGSCKPDAAIYRLALAKAGCAPEQALFVGDSIRHDVEGPAALGMRTAWIPPRAGADPGDAHPDAVIHALGDVLELVGLAVVR